MTNSSVRFACTALAGTNKTGVIPKDADGYYTMVIGGLNMFNSAGQWYDFEGAKGLFENSSQFMRRVKKGNLKGEVGHPRREVGQSLDDFVSRVIDVRETNVCVHFKEIWLDFDRLKDAQGRRVVAIMAKLTPSGPHAAFLQKALDNRHENVNFSIRSFTRDYDNRGVYTRELKSIVTFDYVTEPGISIAEKYSAPSLESFSDDVFSRGAVERAVNSAVAGIGAENALMTMGDLMTAFNWTLPAGAPPAWKNW